jgi:hypothetical protein
MTTPSTEVQLEVLQPTALESIERANVDMQISTAKKFPRSLARVKGRMMELATLDQETAESCFYKLNRQGKSIEGPSIRLAEIAASSFGNIRYGARVIANDGKKITAQGFSHDLETNVYCAVEISRRITTRDGATYSEDMQIVTGNAACAIALRNAMFKVVPFALVKPIYEAAKSTAVGDIKTLAERRTRMLTKLAAMGIDAKRVCATVEKAGIEEIGLAELETLFGLYNAVKDGDQNVDEAFPTVTIQKAQIPAPAKTVETPPAGATTTAEPEQKPAKTPRGAKKAAEKAAAAAPVESGIVGDQPDKPSGNPTVAEVEKRLAAAGYTPEQMIKVCIHENFCETTAKTLADIPEAKLAVFLKWENWDSMLEEIKGLAAPATE